MSGENSVVVPSKEVPCGLSCRDLLECLSVACFWESQETAPEGGKQPQPASRLQAPMSALGFRVTVTKWLSLVRLLLGEVPEHTEFTAPGLAEPLAAYFSIAQAVRSGDLIAFRHGSYPRALQCPP